MFCLNFALAVLYIVSFTPFFAAADGDKNV